MRPRFTVDVPTFQRMLAAAWVLQCQRDQEMSNFRDGAIAVPGSSDDETTIALTSRVCQQSEVATAPALAPTSSSSTASNPPSVRLPDVLTSRAIPRKKDAWVWMKIKVRGWPVPRQVRVAIPRLAALQFKRTLRTAAASAEPVLVLLIMVAFLLAVPRRDLAPTPLRAATQTSHTRASELIARAMTDQVPSPAVASSETGTDQLVPGLGPSHLQVTDLATSSTVETLSRYEIQGLRHRAQFGDDFAALILGMAYETGRYVPQSCEKATYWVGIAAAGGNAAAQYNLSQRYLHGDGVTIDVEEARKWLQKSAAHGYPKAESGLQARGE